MVKFTVHKLGEHIIDNMVVTGPCRDIIMTMAESFLATYYGPPNDELDFAFAEYIIAQAKGKGRLIGYMRSPPQEIH